MKILSLLALAAFVALPLAAEGQGSDTKGKYLYKKNCKTCHAEGGSAKVLTPLSNTQAQWKKVFGGGRPCKTEGAAPKHCSPEQLLDIKTFLINHAADSPQPETCGG